FDRRPAGYFMSEFDASYSTDSPAYTGAEGGYPVGDLNWFPEQLAAWESDPTSTEEDRQVATSFVLNQNYPNPFNPTTTITYALPHAAGVSLVVYNVLGQEVTRLVDGVQQMPGQYTVQWNGTDAAGQRVSSGMYLYRLETGSTVVTRSMMMIK